MTQLLTISANKSAKIPVAIPRTIFNPFFIPESAITWPTSKFSKALLNMNKLMNSPGPDRTVSRISILGYLVKSSTTDSKSTPSKTWPNSCSCAWSFGSNSSKDKSERSTFGNASSSAWMSTLNNLLDLFQINRVSYVVECNKFEYLLLDKRVFFQNIFQVHVRQIKLLWFD